MPKKITIKRYHEVRVLEVDVFMEEHAPDPQEELIDKIEAVAELLGCSEQEAQRLVLSYAK